MAHITNDLGSNLPENLERWAPMLRPGCRNRRVFDVIYSSKKASWTNAEIALKSDLDQKAASEDAKALFDRALLSRGAGTVPSYSKRQDVYREKKKLLTLAGDQKKLAALPTKRKFRGQVVVPVQKVITGKARLLTIDSIDTFSAVRKIDADGIPAELIPARLPEDVFKWALENILKEPGGLKDWGGENLDLFSTHLSIQGKRRAVGIALKGPSKSGLLTPAKMGKNGDQINRLLSQSIDVAIVQYEGPIANSIFSLLEKLSREKARSEEKNIYYCVIDLSDSYRLRLAYPKQFAKAAAQFESFKKPAK